MFWDTGKLLGFSPIIWGLLSSFVGGTRAVSSLGLIFVQYWGNTFLSTLPDVQWFMRIFLSGCCKQKLFPALSELQFCPFAPFLWLFLQPQKIFSHICVLSLRAERNLSLSVCLSPLLPFSKSLLSCSLLCEL